MVKKTLLAAFVFLMPAIAHAGCYTYYPYYQPYYPPQVVIKEKYFVEYVPAFFSGWAPGLAAAYVAAHGGGVNAAQTQPVQPQQTSCEQKLQILTEKVNSLEKLLSSQPKNETTVLPQKAENPGSFIVAHCAKCHTSDVAEARGGKFVMVKDNRPLKLDDKAIGAVMRKMAEGDMPKDHKLADKEFSGVINELLSMNKKDGAP